MEDSFAVAALFALVVIGTPLILLFVNISRVGRLTRRLDDLEKEVKLLRMGVQQPSRQAPRADVVVPPVTQAPPMATRPISDAVVDPARPMEPAEPVTPVAPAPPSSVPEAEPRPRPIEPEPAAAPKPPQMSPVSERPAPKPARTKQEWEALVGGKLLNRIGALALVIGIGFFLKYAFDKDWISEAMRVSIGGGVGVLLLLLGHRFVKRGLNVFAQGLIGAGISVLYLAVYATFNYYHLVSQPVAFGMMSAVTVLTFYLAFRYDSLAVSLLGWAGGFLTPFLLSTGEANAVGLFTYILLLDIGLLSALVKKRSWVILEPLTFAATYIIYLAWYDEYYVPADLRVAIIFAVLFWLLFHALDILHQLRSEPSMPWLRRIVAVVNGFAFYGLMHTLVFDNYPNVMGAVVLGMAAAYYGTFLMLRRRSTFTIEDEARYVLSATALLAVATGIQFRHHEFVAITLLSVEATLLAWYGSRKQVDYIWAGALVLFVAAFTWLVGVVGNFDYESTESYLPVLNLRVLAFATLAAGVGFTATVLRNVPKAKELAGGLHYFWAALIFILIPIEISYYFDRQLAGVTDVNAPILYYRQGLTVAMGWMIYALALIRAGLMSRTIAVVTSGMLVALIASGSAMLQGLSYMPIERFTPVLNFRALTLIVVFAGLLVIAWWLRSMPIEGRFSRSMGTALRIGILLSLFVLLTGETHDYFDHQISRIAAPQNPDAVDEFTRYDAAVRSIEDMKQLVLSGVWLLYSVVLMVLGIARRMQSLRLAAIILYGITILKIFLYDLSDLDTLYRIFSFIGLGLILLGSSYLYQRYKDVILGETPPVENAEPVVDEDVAHEGET
jgi:uncharacterized membrane protein